MGFFRGLGLFIAITCLVWVGVLWHWQSTHRNMSTEDIVLYLVGLPITLFVLLLLVRWAWRGAAARAVGATAAAAAAAPGAGAAGTPAPSGDEAARHRTVQVLAVHAATAAGASVADLLSAAEANAPRPELHDELRDGEGLPVMAAPVKDLPLDDTAEVLAELATELSNQRPELPPLVASDTLVRSLALLATPLAEAVAALAAWPDQLTAPARVPGTPQAPGARHRVRVLTAWPSGLPEPQLELARKWLVRQLRTLGEGVVDPAAWSVQPGSCISGPELWLEADRLFVALQREGLDDPVLLLACHSDLSDDVVRQLDDAGQLFSTAQPKGVIPGEAAAALLLAGPAWPSASEDADPLPHLHRAAVARRDKSIDAPGRVSAELTSELLRQALGAAQLEPEAVSGLADDADQHSARSAELYAAMLALLPQLDLAEDHRMAGHLLGRIGAAGTLLAVGMAARQASETSKPWAALAVGDAQWRLALVARPEAPPPPEETKAKADPAAPGSKTTT